MLHRYLLIQSAISSFFLLILIFILPSCSEQTTNPVKSSTFEENITLSDQLSGTGIIPKPELNTSEKIGENIMAQYPFNEGFGRTLNDITPNNFDGLIDKGAVWSNSGIEGFALKFNKSGKVSIVNQQALNTIGGISFGTISVWFYYSGIPSGQEMVPILYFGDDVYSYYKNCLVLEIGHPENEFLYFTIIRNGVIIQCFDNDFTIQKNRWYHFAAVVSPAGNTGYVNGIELTDRHYNAGTLPTNTEFFSSISKRDLMAFGYGTTGIASAFRYYNGLIDEITIFDRPLRSEEILQIYNSTIGR